MEELKEQVRERIRKYESEVSGCRWHGIVGPTFMMSKIPLDELTWVLERLEALDD